MNLRPNIGAGEFTFNCLLYDLRLKVLIDCTGFGIRDAVKKVIIDVQLTGRRGSEFVWLPNFGRSFVS